MKSVKLACMFLVFLIACTQQEKTAECNSDKECIPSNCCHSSSCVPAEKAPNCEGTLCTMECAPGTIDCGGSCSCVNGKCTAMLAK